MHHILGSNIPAFFTHVIHPFKIKGMHIKIYLLCHQTHRASLALLTGVASVGSWTWPDQSNTGFKSSSKSSKGAVKHRAHAQDQRSHLPKAKGDSGTGFLPSHQSC